MFTLLKEFPAEKVQDILGNGFDIEKAFQHQNTYVLFLTENTPHEETLTVLLLNQAYDELEKIELYAAYTAGILNVIDVDQNVITFTFWSEQPMKLCYLENKKYRWQFKKLTNVSYVGGFLKARHLIVSV